MQFIDQNSKLLFQCKIFPNKRISLKTDWSIYVSWSWFSGRFCYLLLWFQWLCSLDLFGKDFGFLVLFFCSLAVCLFLFILLSLLITVSLPSLILSPSSVSIYFLFSSAHLLVIFPAFLPVCLPCQLIALSVLVLLVYWTSRWDVEVQQFSEQCSAEYLHVISLKCMFS